MSVRGIEIHNGQVVFPEGMPQTFHLGTEASPLTQGEAGQIVVSAVINAIALGGDVKAGLFRVNFTVSMTGNPYVLHAIADVKDGIVITGSLRTAYIQSFLGNASQVAYLWEGMRVNMSADAAAIINALSSIIVNNVVNVQPTARYCFLDLREHGAITVDAGIYVGIGVACDMTNLFELIDNKTAWSSGENVPGGAAGRIAVMVGAQQRYIQLYA